MLELGEIVATPGAIEQSGLAGVSLASLLNKHQSGDWGDLSEEDKNENEFSLEARCRIFSSYIIKEGVKIWIITEADRSSTTFLLPSEY
jgi:hypothetical protein